MKAFEEHVRYYRRYWTKRWASAKPKMCEYCNHRLECLAETEPDSRHCTEAWNRLVYNEGEPP